MDGLARLGWMGIVGGVVLGCTPPTEDVGQLDGDSDDAGMQDTAALESSGAAGSTESSDEGITSTDSADAGETGPVPSTCPPGAPEGPFGDVTCSEGDACTHGDFACGCACFCDEDGSLDDGPGYYECEYARADELVAVPATTTVLDCAAGTLTTDATIAVDNVDGLHPIELAVQGLHSTALVLGDVEYVCKGFCEDGEWCPAPPPVALDAGATAEFVHQFGPALCDAPEGVDLCGFCGTTGELRVRWTVSGADASSSHDTKVPVTIACP